MNNMICIYCKENKPTSSFTKAEHVMPQSFGLFRNNFTLNGIVCDHCNKYFGDNLEIILARDTYEGLLRYQHGIKNSDEFRSLGKRSRLVVKLAEGRYEGSYAYVEYSEEKRVLGIRPLPQIGVLIKGTSEYKYFLLNELPAKSELEKAGFDLNHPKAFIWFHPYHEISEKTLAEKGIKLRPEGTEYPLDPDSKLKCVVERDVDSVLCRSVAKITFNYLAYWEGTEFMLNQSFDPIRNYIRFDEVAEDPLVILSEHPVLADEPESGLRRLGHVVTVNWAQDSFSIVSQVSLLNIQKYVVSLARSYTGERRSIRRGHFFNLRDRKILELKAIRPKREA